MSDHDLRRILQEIIEDLDAGRLRPARPRRLIRWLGAPVLAASLGLGVAGCNDRALGYADDAGAQVDAGSNEDYAAPPVDAGNIFAYGIPPVLEDAGVDASAEEWDGGAYDLYGVPFEEADAAVDPPPEAMYSAPDFEIDPDAGAAPEPSPTPDPAQP
jgi:hypothetical protein